MNVTFRFARFFPRWPGGWLLIWAFMMAAQPARAQLHLWPADTPEGAISREVHQLVNQYRLQKGRKALEAKQELNRIADQHSLDMARGRRPFSHQGFNERVAAVRKYAKIPYHVAENLYATTSPRDVAREALRNWIRSPGHHKNLLGNFLFTGIAVRRSPQGEFFITQLFVGKKQ